LKAVTGHAGPIGTLADLAAADTILVVGADLEVAAPVLLPPIYHAKKKGASVIFIGEVHKLPRYSDIHVRPKDIFHFLVEVADRAMPEAARSAGLPAVRLSDDEQKEAAAVAEKLKTGKLAIVFGEQVCGPEAARTVAMLAKLAGHAKGTLLPAWDGANVQGMLDIGVPGNLPGGIKALYLTQQIEKIPEGVELVILQDIYESGAMERSEVVLPATAFTETEGTVTSLERRLQRLARCAEPPKMSQEDWKIVSRLAAAMGGQGFTYASAKDVTDEMLRAFPGLKHGLMANPPSVNAVNIGGIPTSPPETLVPRGGTCHRGAPVREMVDDHERVMAKWGVPK